jgi:hypothetical protein
MLSRKGEVKGKKQDHSKYKMCEFFLGVEQVNRFTVDCVLQLRLRYLVAECSELQFTARQRSCSFCKSPKNFFFQ